MGTSVTPHDPVVAGLTLDSRKVQPGYLFAALAGSRADGARLTRSTRSPATRSRRTAR